MNSELDHDLESALVDRGDGDLCCGRCLAFRRMKWDSLTSFLIGLVVGFLLMASVVL